MNNDPLVSIVMPAYNSSAFISKTIKSILEQSYTNFELIIIDDGSKDNVYEIAKSFTTDPRIRVFRNEENSGISYTRNKGNSLAKGKYIAILDSDDIWSDTNKIKNQITFLEENPEYLLVGTDADIIDTEDKVVGKIINPETDKEIRDGILLRNPFVHSSVMYRKNILEKIPGYPEYRVCEDFALFLEIGKIGKMKNIKTRSTSYRVNNKSTIHKDKTKAAITFLQIIKKYQKDYPNYYFALIKAYLRIAKEFATNLIKKVI